MTKIILLLAAIAAGYGAFVANENKSEFLKLHTENKDLESKITRLKGDMRSEEASIGDQESALATAKTVRNDAEARRDFNRREVRSRTNSVNTTRTQLNGVNTEIQEITTILTSSNVPDPDALNSSLEEESTKQVELEQAIEEQESELDGLRAQVNDKRGVLGNLRKTIAEANAAFNRKTRRARITAVDPEWGFAIMNMGNTAGISPNDRVIVERAGQRVGMVVVKTVSGGRVVGNVVPEAGTTAPQPGDTVIFESKKESNE